MVGSASKAWLKSSEAGAMRSSGGIWLVDGFDDEGGWEVRSSGFCAPCPPVVIRDSAILSFASEDGNTLISILQTQLCIA